VTHISKGVIVGPLVAILIVGLVRLRPVVSEAPDEVTKYAMALVILAGCLYFGVASLSWKELTRVWHPLSSKRAIVGFMVAILLVGLVRFTLTVLGTPDGATRYASMTAVILAGCVFFGASSSSWKELLAVSYFLILPYMAVELFGIGYTWATGTTTIFHTPEYSFGLDLDLHFWGHLVGGLTWEPLSLFIVMFIVHAMAKLWTSWRRRPSPEEDA
jgi:hypothetical protein